MMLTQAYVQSILDYNPDTGVFKWKKHKPNTTVGAVAGHINTHGYREITIEYKGYYASKLAWLYVYGVWPEKIDHKNSDRLLDSISNLRAATYSENNCNRVKSSINTTGIKGLSLNKQAQGRPRWSASISKNGKRMIKYFKIHEKEQAIEWLKTTRESLHGEFCNHG